MTTDPRISPERLLALKVLRRVADGAFADRAFAAVRVPPVLKAPRTDLQMRADDLRGALRNANPALRDDMLSLHCSHGELVEVRICLDKDVAPRRCGKRMRTGCPVSAPFTIPASR